MTPSYFTEMGFMEAMGKCSAEHSNVRLVEDLRLVILDTYLKTKLPTQGTFKHPPMKMLEPGRKPNMYLLKENMLPSSLREHMELLFNFLPTGKPELEYWLTEFVPKEKYVVRSDVRYATLTFVITGIVGWKFFSDYQLDLQTAVEFHNQCILINNSLWVNESTPAAEISVTLAVSDKRLRHESNKLTFSQINARMSLQRGATKLDWNNIPLEW